MGLSRGTFLLWDRDDEEMCSSLGKGCVCANQLVFCVCEWIRVGFSRIDFEIMCFCVLRAKTGSSDEVCVLKSLGLRLAFCVVSAPYISPVGSTCDLFERM